MIISYISKSAQELHFKITLEPNESKKATGQDNAIELVGDSFCFIFPFPVEHIHPDLLALAILTVVYPWVEDEIRFPEDVSLHFANSIRGNCKFVVTNIDKNLSSRKLGDRDAISFSGGSDSIAATRVLPEDTVKLMFLRKEHKYIEDIHQHYSINAQKEIIRMFENAYCIESDLEHVVGPFPQYPTWATLSLQCILLADHFNLKSVNFGTIVGSTEIKDGKKYKRIDRLNGFWSPLFKSVGLLICKPVAGMTEVATASIVKASNLDHIATSCQYGSMNLPCMECFKCFRKYLLVSAISCEKLSSNTIGSFLKQRSIQKYLLGEPPLYFHHIFMWALSKIDVEKSHLAIKLFKEKLLLSNNTIEWCERHYADGITRFIPDQKLRNIVQGKISDYITPMSKEDVSTYENWDLYRDYAGDTIGEKLKLIDNMLIYIFENINDCESNLRTIQGLQNNTQKQNKDIQKLHNQINKLANSKSYRLGNLLIRSIKKPYKLLASFNRNH